jgi:hypothetical protein
MPKQSSPTISTLATEADLQAAYQLTSEAGELVAPFFFSASDGGLALIRKLGEKYNLAFYTKTATGVAKVGEVTHIEALDDARVIAKEELQLPLAQPRSFRWAKLKDDVVLVDGEAFSGASDDVPDGVQARLPEGLLVKFIAAGTEPGKLVVNGDGRNFEVSRRLLNLL